MALDLTGQQFRALGCPESVRQDAAAYVRRHARDTDDAALLLDALNLPDTDATREGEPHG